LRGLQRLAGLTLITFISLGALAQTSQNLRDRDPDLEGSKKLALELSQANFHYGPFYLLSKLRLADAGYTASASLPTGDQSGGLAISVEAPQRLYYVPYKKTILSVEVTPGYSFVSSGDRDGQFNYTARGDAHFLLNHLYLDAYALRERQLRAHIADINRLATVRTDEGGVMSEFKYSSKTSALVTFRARKSNFPDDALQPEDVPVNLLDRSERNGRVSLRHKTFPLTSFFVATERSDYGFDRASYKDSSRTYYGAGAIWSSLRTTLRVEAGSTKLDFDNPAELDYSGVMGAINFERRSGRRIWSAALERDIGFSIFADNNYFVSNVLRAGVSHDATSRLTLRAGSIHERDDYDVPVDGIDRKDTISFTSVGFVYNFRRVNAGLDAGWYDRTSTIGGDSDSGIRYVVHLSFIP
jgi:hypothetical protein